jgi:hypothetical protein
MSALALIASAAVGLHVNTSKMNTIHAAADAAPDGPIPESVSGLVNDPVLFASVHALTLVTVGIIWNMTTKPGDIQAFLAIVLLAAAGVASAYPMYQRQRERLAD